jgi:hypothetical protein
MVWQPGQSGNPSGWQGGRQRRHREVFDEIKKLGYRDALITLAKLQHESQDESIQAQAAGLLVPYAHPKLQSISTPRFIENPIDVPDFTSVEVARDFIATVTVRVARGELDFQSGQELIAMTKVWLDAMNDQSTLELKQISIDGPSDTTIRVEGGLPELPGTNITMPLLNGHNGHALAAPAPAATEPPENDSSRKHQGNIEP